MERGREFNPYPSKVTPRMIAGPQATCRQVRNSHRIMRIGEIIGSVTLNRSHPSLAGASYKLVVPLSHANLTGAAPITAEELVVFDEWGAGIGSHIAIREGGEAAQPFYPDMKPIDAYNAAILDQIHLRENLRT